MVCGAWQAHFGEAEIEQLSCRTRSPAHSSLQITMRLSRVSHCFRNVSYTAGPDQRQNLVRSEPLAGDKDMGFKKSIEVTMLRHRLRGCYAPRATHT